MSKLAGQISAITPLDRAIDGTKKPKPRAPRKTETAPEVGTTLFCHCGDRFDDAGKAWRHIRAGCEAAQRHILAGLRDATGRRFVAVCGTEAGYRRHVRIKELVCQQCKDFVNIQRRERRAKNREKYKAQKREWLAANRGKVNAQTRERRAKNREEYNAQQREQWTTNREQINARRRERCAANREEINAQQRERWAKNREELNARQRERRAAKKAEAASDRPAP